MHQEPDRYYCPSATWVARDIYSATLVEEYALDGPRPYTRSFSLKEGDGMRYRARFFVILSEFGSSVDKGALVLYPGMNNKWAGPT